MTLKKNKTMCWQCGSIVKPDPITLAGADRIGRSFPAPIFSGARQNSRMKKKRSWLPVRASSNLGRISHKWQASAFQKERPLLPIKAPSNLGHTPLKLHGPPLRSKHTWLKGRKSSIPRSKEKYYSRSSQAGFCPECGARLIW